MLTRKDFIKRAFICLPVLPFLINKINTKKPLAKGGYVDAKDGFIIGRYTDDHEAIIPLNDEVQKQFNDMILSERESLKSLSITIK